MGDRRRDGSVRPRRGGDGDGAEGRRHGDPLRCGGGGAAGAGGGEEEESAGGAVAEHGGAPVGQVGDGRRCHGYGGGKLWLGFGPHHHREVRRRERTRKKKKMCGQ